MKIFILFPSIIGLFYSCSKKISISQSAVYSKLIISTPTIFAEGVISTKDKSVFNVAFTNNGHTVYFTRRQLNEKQKIYFSNFNNYKWTKPQLASFSTDRDENPFITADGKTLYFGSQRAIPNNPTKGNFDMNIWKTQLTNHVWTAPTPIAETINKIQIGQEEWPSSNENSIYTFNNSIFYFATMLRGTKTIDIYETKLINNEFSKPVKLNGLFDEDKYWKSTPVISPDGEYLLFNAYDAPNGKGGEDIYVSKKNSNGSWGKAVNIGGLVNTKAEEAAANFSPDGKYFFFARELKQNPATDGIWTIFHIETKFLRLNELFNN